MSASKAIVLLIVVLVLRGVSAADDYTAVDKLLDGKRSGETSEAARARWQDAKKKLDKMNPGNPRDYRHCYYRALALFRLDGPIVSRDERRTCTLSFVNGTRHDGAPAEPNVRANGINELSALVEEYLQKEVQRLTATLQQIKQSGTSTVIVTRKAIQRLVDSGRLTRDEAKKLTEQLDSVEATFDLRVDKLDPKSFDPADLDWNRLDLDKVPADIKEKLLKHEISPGTGGRPTGTNPSR